MAVNEKDKPLHEGDVLGISNSDPSVTIPHPPSDGSPLQGIDVREHATGIGDLKRSKGATGIDMGAAGSGTDVARESSKPKSAVDPEE
jgi:hypothetical protein